MPLISVIVPIYNAEKTLRNCLDHLLAQSFQDFEVLLVNDGSRDASAEICNEYCRKDPRFKYIEKENGGVSSARNAGIPHARGSYMTFADADDYALENWLSDCTPFMDGVGLVVTGAKTTGFNTFHPDYLPESRRLQTPEGLAELVRVDMLGYTWHKFYRSELLQQLKLRFDQNYLPNEDEELLLRYISHIDEIQFVHSEQYVYDVPDFENKYTELPYSKRKDIFEALRRIGSKEVLFNYIDRYPIKWLLRKGKLSPSEFSLLQRQLGFEGIWRQKASLGTRLLLLLPAFIVVPIFRLEGKRMLK